MHFSDRHKHGSGMTFVDLVFPGFLFIVGMSIPFALRGHLNKGEAIWKTCGHVILLLARASRHRNPDGERRIRLA